MRFWIEATERDTRDPQELAAMLRHRIDSIDYQKDLMEQRKLRYSYKSIDGHQTYMSAEFDNVEDLDRQIKNDPLFPYAIFETKPLIPVGHLVNEIQEYLKEEIMSEDEILDLAEPERPPVRQPGEKLFFVRKVVSPFSPLLEDEVQRDIHRRTVLSQQYHWAIVELHDENPAGQPIGLLIAKAQQMEDVQKHVADCEVYPDTEAAISELHSLDEARQAAVTKLRSLRRDPDATPEFRGF